MAALITGIYDVIKNGGDDQAVDQAINDYLSGDYYKGQATTVAQWRVDNYAQLRRWAYPPLAEYNDAQTKINSGVSSLETEGQQQLASYVSACLDVKTRFPKEQA